MLPQILIENGAATGVEFVQDGEKRIARLAPGGEVSITEQPVHRPPLACLTEVAIRGVISSFEERGRH